MQRFAFIVHPIDARRDVSRKYPIAKFLPNRSIEWYIKKRDPLIVADAIGIRSITGEEARGWFIACPLTPRQLVSLPLDFVWNKLEQCGRLAQEVGAGILGLGAFTSVVGDGGITIERRLRERNVTIAVTTGNSYTVATAVEAALDGAIRMGISIENAKVAVVGATGSIGRTCAHLLAPRTAEIALIGRDIGRLEQVASEIPSPNVSLYSDVRTGLRDAQLVVTVTSAVEAVIQPEDLAIGAVVCDVARPRDTSVRVVKERDDVLVVEGGVVAVPGPDADFHFNFGFPSKTAYACMSETMILALEGRYESFTLGKDVTVAQVQEIARLAAKHGFQLAGYRSFEKAVTEETIAATRRNAERKRREAAKPETVTVAA